MPSPGFNVNEDYYAILSLSRSAEHIDLKRILKDFAMRYHPDRNNGDPESAEKFKEMYEAYEVLSDPDLREQYDRVCPNAGLHRPNPPKTATPPPEMGRRTSRPYSYSWNTNAQTSAPDDRQESEQRPPSPSPSPTPSFTSSYSPRSHPTRPAPFPSSSSSYESHSSTPAFNKPAHRCTFSDYYFSNYKPKPHVLPALHKAQDDATSKWRRADHEAKDARFVMDYHTATGSEPTKSRMIWNESREYAERLRSEKWTAVALSKEHHARASLLLKRRRLADQRIKGLDAMWRRAQRRREQGY